jgi:hypothetical protein
MSSTGMSKADVKAVAQAASPANVVAAAIILGLFVLAAIFGAERKDITRGFDEVAHVSYVAHLQHSGDFWPAFNTMRLIDPRTFQFTDKPNYLNHPPMFYALLAALGPGLVGRPQALLLDRLIDVAMVTFGLAALIWLGLAARLPRTEFYAYALPIACIPVLAPLAGAVNNDDLAFLGGALATLGVWQSAESGYAVGPAGSTRAAPWLALALIGMILAGWAKLTGLVLTAGMVGSLFAYLLWRRRLPWSSLAWAATAFAVAAAPYVVYLIQYGSPVPDIPAQIAMLQHDAQAVGWAGLPRKPFPAYLGYFVVAFVAEWMPALGARSIVNYAMLAIPVAAVICGALGAALSARRLWRREETALDLAVTAGTLSLAATLAIHIRYSYLHYLVTGWLLEAYPRYYLPLAAIVPLAGLSLAAAVQSPSRRSALLAFLIGGPIVFRLFGAPLG